MTLPRWWDNRLKFGLALIFLVVNVSIHLSLLSHPTLTFGWTMGVFLYSIAFLLFLLIKDNSRRPLPPPAKPTPTWRERAAKFAQMPLWAQVICVLVNALILYALLLAVLALANSFTHWDDSSLYNLRSLSALLSFFSLKDALTAAEGLGWWNGWETAGGSR